MAEVLTSAICPFHVISIGSANQFETDYQMHPPITKQLFEKKSHSN
jgi:hypothetical protein